MIISKFELELINRVYIDCLQELNISGLIINDGKIVGRLDEEEDNAFIS